ncbi:MAG TPA: hypothetical protein VGH82_15355 [Gaiellaceae bacterium]
MTSGRKSRARRHATVPPVGKQQGISTRAWLLGGGAVAAVVLVIVLVVVLTQGGSGGQTIGPEGIPIPTGPQLASAGTANGGQAIDGIQCNAGEQVAYHIHARLTVFDNGNSRQIPYGIGIAPPREVQQTPNGPFVVAGRCFYWLHTHAADGIIHVESPTKRTYTLGNFFDVWHEPLGASRVGPLTGPVTAFLDGKIYAGNPRTIALQPHAQIQLDVGRPLVKPVSISNWNGL